MTLPNLPPVPGTPIHGIGDIAGMAGRNMEHTRAALSADTGLGIHAHTTGNSVTYSMDIQAQLVAFRICDCWKKQSQNVWGGNILGCYWWCHAIPVPYWKLWKGDDGHGGLLDPDSFWKQFDLDPDYIPNKIFWVVDNSDCCQPLSSGSASPCLTTPDICCSGDDCEPCCQDENAWQANLYPRFGIGQIVWCIKDHQAGVWRVLDAYENIVKFQLAEPLKGCHTSALAYMLGYECCDDGLACQLPSSSVLPSYCPDQEWADTTPCPSCNGSSAVATTYHDTGRKLAVIRVQDPMGIVNLQMPKPQADVTKIVLGEMQDCVMTLVDKLTSPGTVCVLPDDLPDVVPPDGVTWHDCEIYGDCCNDDGETGGNAHFNAYLNAYLCEYMKGYMDSYMGTFMHYFTEDYTKQLTCALTKIKCEENRLDNEERTAPTGTMGWAHYSVERRQWEVVSYGQCDCEIPCPPCSSSSCSSCSCDYWHISSEWPFNQCDSMECNLWPPPLGPCASSCCEDAVQFVYYDSENCKLDVTYNKLCMVCGKPQWQNDADVIEYDLRQHFVFPAIQHTHYNTDTCELTFTNNNMHLGDVDDCNGYHWGGSSEADDVVYTLGQHFTFDAVRSVTFDTNTCELTTEHGTVHLGGSGCNSTQWVTASGDTQTWDIGSCCHCSSHHPPTASPPANAYYTPSCLIAVQSAPGVPESALGEYTPDGSHEGYPVYTNYQWWIWTNPVDECRYFSNANPRVVGSEVAAGPAHSSWKNTGYGWQPNHNVTGSIFIGPCPPSSS